MRDVMASPAAWLIQIGGRKGNKMVCIAERIKIIGTNSSLGFMVLCKDHYEWEPDPGPYTYPTASLQTIACGMANYNKQLTIQLAQKEFAPLKKEISGGGSANP